MVDSINKDKNETQQGEKKIVKLLSNLLFIVFMITIIFLIFITAQSKLSGMEPSLLGHKLYVVESGSMLPTLKIGSMIVVKELPASEIGVGDMLSYYGKNIDVKVTHRVVEVQNGGDSFITRGDANNANDPSPVEKDRVVGKVIFTVPFIGIIFQVLSNPMAIILLVILGICWIVIPELLKRRNKNRAKGG